MARHAELNIHAYEPNRPAPDQDERTTNCSELGRVKILEGDYLEALGAERTQYMSYLSSLQLSAHQGMSIEDALKLRTNALNHSAVSNDSNDTLQKLIDTLLKDAAEDDDDDLQQAPGELEDNEEGNNGYEELRHRLGMREGSRPG